MLPSRTWLWAGFALPFFLGACAGLVGADFDGLSTSSNPTESPAETDAASPDDGGGGGEGADATLPKADAGPDAPLVDVTCYRDEDNDGFGTDAGKSFPGACPAGWKPVAGDCDDAAKDAHPGQTQQFLEPHNGSFDYDCDGKQTGTLKMPSKPNTPFSTKCETYSEQAACLKAVILPPIECGIKGTSTTMCAWFGSRNPPCFATTVSPGVDYEVVCR